MNNPFRQFTVSLLLIFSSSLVFANTFLINAVPDRQNPANMVPGSFALATYTVQNITSKESFDAVNVNLDKGATQIFEDGMCGYIEVEVDERNCGYGSTDGKFPLENQVGICTLLICLDGTEIDAQGGLKNALQVCGRPGLYCDYPPELYRLNVEPLNPANEPQITVSPADSELRPGTVFQWTITNHGPGTAYQINVFPPIPDSIFQYISYIDTTDCWVLSDEAGENTCTISARIVSGAPEVAAEEINFKGANTNEYQVEAEIIPFDLVTLNSLVFNLPGCQTMSLQNNGTLPITNVTITLPTPPMMGVSYPAAGSSPCGLGNTCVSGSGSVSIGPNAACTIDVVVDDLATVATGTVVADFTEDTEPGTVSATITITNENIIVNDGNPIELSLDTPEIDVVIFNPINNDDAEITAIGFSTPIPGVSLDTSDCPIFPTARLIAGASCTIKFSTEELTIVPSITGALQVIGNNFVPATETVTVDPLTITVDTKFNHLQYRRIAFTNKIPGSSVYIGDVEIGPNLDNTSICTTDCDSYDLDNNSQSNLCDGVVPELSTCYILFKSDISDNLGAASDTITIPVMVADDPTRTITTVFAAQQATSLYVSGSFDTAGTGASAVSVENVAAYDGTNWSALSLGLMGGNGNALAFYNGDLYAGGDFVNAGGMGFTQYLAAWNGANWTSLGTSYAYLDDYVNAFTQDDQGNLIIGGQFTQIFEVAKENEKVIILGQASAPGLAVWNSTQNNPELQPLQYNSITYGINQTDINNATVNALLFDSAYGLYVGGVFADTMPTLGATSPNTALLAGDLGWAPMQKGTSNSFAAPPAVNAFLAVDTFIYAAGNFNVVTNSTAPVSADYVAQWNPVIGSSIWSALGTGLVSTGYALNNFASEVYAGGAFGLATYDGIDWNSAGPTSPSISGSVNALFPFLNSTPNVFYVGGQFNSTYSNLLSFDETTWSVVGGGVTFSDDSDVPNVSAIVVAPSLNISSYDLNP